MSYSAFRASFFVAFGVTLALAVYSVWLWQPARQIRSHNAHFLQAVESRDWSRVDALVAANYEDQWGDDKKLLVQRLREVSRYVREFKISPAEPSISVINDDADWSAKITIETDGGEIASAMKERLNAVATPFRFHWHRESWKPWDWKLVRVANPALQLPEAAEQF